MRVRPFLGPDGELRPRRALGGYYNDPRCGVPGAVSMTLGGSGRHVSANLERRTARSRLYRSRALQVHIRWNQGSLESS